MGHTSLIEVPDPSVLPLVDFLLRRYTKEGRASTVTLIYTGNRLREICELSQVTIQPHFEICGFLEAKAADQEEIVGLLLGGPTQVSLDLHYGWGVLHIFLHATPPSGTGYLTVDREAHPESLSSEKGRYLRGGAASELSSYFGLTDSSDSRLPGGGRLKFDQTDAGETLRISFGPEDEPSVQAFVRQFVRSLEPPSRIHVILTGDLETVRDLSESGRVIPCRGCCAWHFAYRSPEQNRTDVDITRLDQAIALLRNQPGRDRSITFSDFTWRWEKDLDPKSVNRLIWTLPRRGEGRIEIGWYESLPRGTVDRLRGDAQQFIESSTCPDDGRMM